MLNETSDAENQLTLGSSMDLPAGVELDAQLRWIDTLRSNNGGWEGTVTSYLDLTVGFGIHLTDRWEFSIIGQNLLDEYHAEFGVPGVN